jgi:hypothetical protein
VVYECIFSELNNLLNVSIEKNGLGNLSFLITLIFIPFYLSYSIPHPPHKLIGTKTGPRKRGGSENSCPARVPLMPWTGRHGRAARHFPFSPGWASKALTHLTGDGQWATQPEGTGATPCSPPVMGEREEGRKVPTLPRVSTALMIRDYLCF